MWSSTFTYKCEVARNVELARQTLANRGSRRSQLHILWGLKGLQPIENRGVSAPRCARLTGNRFDPADRSTLHLQIDFRVTGRRGRAGVSEILADRRQVNAGLQQCYSRTVAQVMLRVALSLTSSRG